MEILKIRRVGNSNVVTIPKGVAGDEFVEGAQVVIDRNDRGELTITPAARVREKIFDMGTRIAAERAEALKILATHDPTAHG